MKQGFVRQQNARKHTRTSVKSGRILRHAMVIGAVDKKAYHNGGERGANEPFFSDRRWSSNNRGLHSFRTMEEEDAREREKRKSEKHVRSLALILTAGIFRRQVFREIYGEVTAWIAMNSAHPPLSDLVIVQDLLVPQVLRA